jgi:chaperonin cofactor prefoldin
MPPEYNEAVNRYSKLSAEMNMHVKNQERYEAQLNETTMVKEVSDT